MAHIGYRRVSTTQQVTDRQLVDIELDKVFEDKLSGKTTDRAEFQAMLSYVREGDTLHVHSLDRLGRNLSDILATVEALTGKGVVLVSHKEGIDTSRTDPMSKAVVSLFGMFAELERGMMLARQQESIAVAKAKGTWKARGNQKSIDREAILHALAEGGSVRKVAAAFDISTNTVSRIKKEMQAA